jgi:acetolactate synthase-1/3 small subunit
MSTHTLSVLVEDKPGVLARVSGLFSRRGFNIDSLAVGETEQPGISRITIVVNVESSPLEQVTKQLNKLVNVLKIVELDPQQSVQRELLLVKVRADRTVRGQVLETVELFRAKVIEEANSVNDRPVVVDFIVHEDAMVWPMVAAGTSNDEIMAARDVRPDFGDNEDD